MSENNFDIYIRRINLSLQKPINVPNFLGHNSKNMFCFNQCFIENFIIILHLELILIKKLCLLDQ